MRTETSAGSLLFLCWVKAHLPITYMAGVPPFNHKNTDVASFGIRGVSGVLIASEYNVSKLWGYRLFTIEIQLRVKGIDQIRRALFEIVQ